jgi:hypothetical protein
MAAQSRPRPPKRGNRKLSDAVAPLVSSSTVGKSRARTHCALTLTRGPPTRRSLPQYCIKKTLQHMASALQTRHSRRSTSDHWLVFCLMMNLDLYRRSMMTPDASTIASPCHCPLPRSGITSVQHARKTQFGRIAVHCHSLFLGYRGVRFECPLTIVSFSILRG